MKQCSLRKDAANMMRDSGVECLRLFGMLLIVTSHVIQTFGYDSPYISDTSYVIPYTMPSANIQYLITAIFSFSGAFGNTLFFICSAWFLLDSQKVSYKKWFFLFVEVWVLSVAILGVTYLHRGGEIDKEIFIHSFFPNLFGNNWYISCYLLFYPVHTTLNKVIQSMSQQQLFRTAAIFFLLYSALSYLRGGLFFPSMLITWLMLYFFVAYVKFYRKDIVESRKANLTALLLSGFSLVSIIITINYLGLRYSFFSTRLLQGSSTSNPFIIICAFSLFLLARSVSWKSRLINYMAKLTLLVYLIHENGIIATYYRPMAARFIYTRLGYDHLVLWIFLLAVFIFVLSLLIACVYDLTARKLVKRMSEIVSKLIISLWMKCERFFLRNEPTK